MKNNSNGGSFLEMMGVLAIIGVLSIGGLQGYLSATTRIKSTETISQIAHLSTNLRTLYMQQTSYEGLNNATAVQMMATPIDMGVGDVLLSPFRGNVTIGSGRLFKGETGNSHKAFYLIYDKLNKQLCVQIATANWSGDGVNLVALGVFGKDVERSKIDELAMNTPHNYEGYDGEYGIATLNGSVLSVPIPMAKAGKFCDCDKQSRTCTIFWKYR